MQEKTVIVYLDTGLANEHVLAARDDADYADTINQCTAALTGNERGVLGFTTPLCIYKVQHVIAIEFCDPPPETETLPIGFRPPP